MARKFSAFTNGLTNQSPTDTLVGLDVSLSAANQNSFWTLNSLFSVITRNITDGALRFQGFAAPLVSAAGQGSIYFDSSSNKFKISQNGSAYANLENGLSGLVSGNLIKANSTTTATDAGIVSTECANSVNSRYNVANYASLAAAVAAIGGSTQATIVIASSVSVTSSLTVTGNITLEFTNAGALNISAAQVVTILGSINAPLKQIFIGSGSVTFLNNRRLAYLYPQWWGGVPDGSTDSTTACNAAINGAISMQGSGGGTVYFTPGTWIANLSIVEARGIRLEGNARITTIIQSTGANSTVQTNGIWYSKFTGLTFRAGATLSGAAVFELDGNYDGSHTQGVQANTFEDCYFEANSLAYYCVAICRQGGNGAQGSENLFINCHFQSPTFAGVYIAGANALQNTFLGGNFQAFGYYGIYCLFGSFNAYSVGLQYAAANVRTMIEREGWDFYILNSADDHYTIDSCRSESPKFCYVANDAAVTLSNNSAIPPVSVWAATTAYSQGAIVKGVTGGNGNGKLYIAITGGTSGGSEPTWPATDTIYQTSGATIGVGSTTPTLSTTANVNVGDGIIINGAGVAGANLYATVTGLAPDTISVAASTAVTSQPYRIGPTVTDGSVVWMQYDFFIVQYGSGFADVRNNNFPYGRFIIGANRPASLVLNTFSRSDWLGQSGAPYGGNYVDNQITLIGNRVYLNGGPNTGGAITSYPVNVRNGGAYPASYVAPLSVGGQTLVWAGGVAGVTAADISITPDFANARLTCNSDLRGTFATKASNPTTSDIAASTWAVYKNTSSGVLSLWANDGGVMKSVALT